VYYIFLGSEADVVASFLSEIEMLAQLRAFWSGLNHERFSAWTEERRRREQTREEEHRDQANAVAESLALWRMKTTIPLCSKSDNISCEHAS
jgi:hypothetical protein